MAHYTISNTGVIDTGRPGNGPYAWAHDIIEHSVIPHPDRCIDELLALGGGLFYHCDRKLSDKHLEKVLGFLYERCELPSVSDFSPSPELEQKIGRWFNWSGNVCRSVAGWIDKGSELFKERFPSNYTEVGKSLTGKIDGAYILRNKHNVMFDELTVDFDSYSVKGYNSVTGKTILFYGYDFRRGGPIYEVMGGGVRA